MEKWESIFKLGSFYQTGKTRNFTQNSGKSGHVDTGKLGKYLKSQKICRPEKANNCEK